MPFWSIAYILLLAYSGAQSVLSARRGQRPRWFMMLDVVTAGAWILLVVAFVRPEVADALGRIALIAFGVAMLWTLASAPFEVTRLRPDPNLSERANAVADWVIIGISVLFVVPAVTIGALVVRDLFRG
jgi:hypothetical protein